MRPLTAKNETGEVTAADPSTVFIVKSLLYPVAAVLTLLICLRIEGESLYGPYFLIAVLAFFGAADFLDGAPVHTWRGWNFAFLQLFDILLRWLLVVGFIWILLRLSGLTTHDEVNTRVLSAWAIATPVVLWCAQFGACYALFVNGSRRPPTRRAVIIGATEIGLRLERALTDDRLLGTHVVGYFDDRSRDRLTLSPNSRDLLGTLQTLPAYVLSQGINVVYITLPMKRDPRVFALLDALRDSTASVYFVPDLFVFNLIQARFDLVNGIPLVAVCESPFFGVRGIAKRLSDLIAAAAMILVASPILIIVSLMVRLSSAGPVIFKQKRCGLDGKSITVYKFRSMTVTEDGESTYQQVTKQDSRVTAVGQFIRKTSLDELPQLFNVLDGSMSIVGPRPHAVMVNEQYRRLIPGYMVRHKVKPGITGWAQVHGFRGGNDLESMQKRIEFDLDYLRNWSLWLDLVILLRTAALVWKDKQAY